jgi:hypothetical protein
LQGAWRGVLSIGVLLWFLGTPLPAAAQAGWYSIPSLSLTEEFDDNVFNTVSPSADIITRLSTGLKVGYRSIPLTLLATGSADAELFAYHPELDGLNRSQVGLESEWIPVQPLVLRLGASFTKTETPAELSPAVGLNLGRQESTQLIVMPSLSYKLNRATTADVGYAYVYSESDSDTSTTHEPRLRVGYELTRVDVGTATYSFRSITSDEGSAESHIVLLGWIRRLASGTRLTLEAGPRISASGVEAEAYASLSHRLHRLVDTSVAYSRSTSAIVGQPGVSSIQTIAAQVSVEPLRSLRLVVGALVAEVSNGGDDTFAQGVDIAASYRLMRWLSAVARYRFTHSSTRGTEIFHNIGSIGLEASYPIRIDD